MHMETTQLRLAETNSIFSYETHLSELKTGDVFVYRYLCVYVCMCVYILGVCLCVCVCVCLCCVACF